MKKFLLFITILAVTCGILNAQNRKVARGAEPGELYMSDFWYGEGGPVFYDVIKQAVYRLTENGKKLTIQYSADLDANPEQTMRPQRILADATSGVVYSRTVYSINQFRTQLWCSMDKGVNWELRDDNVGEKTYISSNITNIIYRGGTDGTFESKDRGKTFYKMEHNGLGMELGFQYGEGWRLWHTQRKIFHSYNFYETFFNT